MKQQKVTLEKEKTESQASERSSGFIMLLMIPIFLVTLTFATAITGCISCSIQAMAHRNEMMQAYSLLEDDSAPWRNEALPDEWKNIYENDYEKVVSTQKAGPYILLVKEMRNKITGKVLVNRLEFIPIDKEDDHTS
jgi:hypothetical protein